MRLKDRVNEYLMLPVAMKGDRVVVKKKKRVRVEDVKEKISRK